MTITIENANQTIFEALKKLLSAWNNVEVVANENDFQDEVLAAIDDVREKRNLSAPFSSAKEAVAAMIED